MAKSSVTSSASSKAGSSDSSLSIEVLRNEPVKSRLHFLGPPVREGGPEGFDWEGWLDSDKPAGTARGSRACYTWRGRGGGTKKWGGRGWRGDEESEIVDSDESTSPSQLNSSDSCHQPVVSLPPFKPIISVPSQYATMVEFLPQATSTPLLSLPLPHPPPGPADDGTSFVLPQPLATPMVSQPLPLALVTPTFSKPLPLATSTPLAQTLPPACNSNTNTSTTSQLLSPTCSGGAAPPTLEQSWDHKGEVAGSGGPTSETEEGRDNGYEQKTTNKATPNINTRKTRKLRFSSKNRRWKKVKTPNMELRKVTNKGTGRKGRKRNGKGKKCPNMEKPFQIEARNGSVTGKCSPDNMEGSRFPNNEGNKCPNMESRSRRKRVKGKETMHPNVSLSGETCNSTSQHDPSQSTYTFSTSPLQTTQPKPLLQCTSRPSRPHAPPLQSSVTTRPFSMYPQGLKFPPDPLTTPLHQASKTNGTNLKVADVTNYFRPLDTPTDMLIRKATPTSN